MNNLTNFELKFLRLLFIPKIIVLFGPDLVYLSPPHALESTLSPDGADVDVAKRSSKKQDPHRGMEDVASEPLAASTVQPAINHAAAKMAMPILQYRFIM